MRYLASLLLTAGLAFSPAPAVAAENLIQNGSFEEGRFVGSLADAPWVTFSVGTYNGRGMYGDMMNHWSISVGSVDLINGYWQASDGTASVDLIGQDFTAELWQDFQPTAGKYYSVSFDVAANPDVPSEEVSIFKLLTVTVTNLSDPQPWLQSLINVDHTGRTRSEMGWESHSFGFWATGSSARLSFEANSESCCWGPTIDNIAIMEALPPPISEPQTYAMLLAGLGMIAGVARRRRRRI